MRALLFEKKINFRTNYPIPRPKYNEALIRITLAGICNTDLEIMKGYMDFQGVPGHEFAGIVEKYGEKTWEGKRVAGEICLKLAITMQISFVQTFEMIKVKR